MSAWQARPVPLRVAVGDLSLMAFKLTLLVETRHFTQGTDEARLDALPKLGAGVDGYLLRSQPERARAPRLSRSGGYLLYVPRRYERYWVDLSMPYEAYLDSFSPKSRSTLRRKVRQIMKENGGALDFRVYKTPSELERFHGLARRLSQQTYQERLLGAGLPDTEDFVAALRERAGRDAARGYLLFVKEEPAAFTYCPVDDGVLSYEHTGFDRRYRHLSPGTVLQWLILEDLFKEGRFRLFDFTEGAGAHKALFATHSLACRDLYILKPSARTWTAVLAQTAIEGMGEAAGAALARIGLKGRIKALLRGGLQAGRA
jgi:CelD/BcsL family acetyltransferase involved in cellulose biosynthesis